MLTDEQKKKLKDMGYNDGQIAVYEAVRPKPQEKKQSFLKEAAKDPFRTLIVKPGARLGQALTDPTMIGRADVNTSQQDDLTSQQQLIGDRMKRAKTPEEKERLRAELSNLVGQVKVNQDRSAQTFGKMGDQDTTVDLGPMGSYDIQGQQAGVEGWKQIGGDALKTASYLYAPGAAKNVVGNGIGQGFRRGMGFGLAEGTAYGAGNAMEQGKSWGEVGQEALIGGATGMIGGGILGAAVPAVGAAYRGTRNAVDSALTGAKDLYNKSANSGFLKGVSDVASSMGEDAKRLPSRIQTNVGQVQAKKAAIEALPTQAMRNAAQDGVEMSDISRIYTMPKDQAPQLRRLWQAAAELSDGNSKADPISEVGKPIVARLREMDAQANRVGSRLSAEAKNLGPVTSNEAYPAVMKRLRSVPGLDGLTVDAKGTLNFRNTTLATGGSQSDRKAIQQIFKDAVKWGNGEGKHKLRQELFEILGGKRKSLEKMTATQERAYDAIRDALADVLETKNPAYKALNQEYAKLVGPMRDMRKMMRAGNFADEDILEMQAGLLAQRLTSLSQSNPQLRMILAAMDEAMPGGSTKVSLEAMQDFYNILNKYYDIQPRTGFEGKVTSGVERATGLGEMVTGKLKEFAGETPAVRRQALEGMLEELLGPKPGGKGMGYMNAAGAGAGIEQGDDGGMSFDPKKAAIGLAAGTVAGKVGRKGPKLHAEDMGVMEKFIDAVRIGGKKGPKTLLTDAKRIAEHYGIKGWKNATGLANKFDDRLAREGYRGTDEATGFTTKKLTD